MASVWDAPRHVREQFQVILNRARRKFGTAPDTCWIWDGKVNKQGYGEWKWYDFRDKKQHGSGSHKISLELKLGEKLPEGYVAGHCCPKPPNGVNPDRRCFRPEHLESITYSQNTKDWYALRRANVHAVTDIVDMSVEADPGLLEPPIDAGDAGCEGE